MGDLQYKLHCSARVGDTDGVERALEEGAQAALPDDSMSREPLHHACAGGHVEVAKLLLTHGSDPNSVSRHGGDAGATPVHLAAEGGYSRVLRVLLAAGADADVYDYNGMQPVHRAATRGRKKVLEVLRDHGCDLSSRVATDWSTTLHHAAAHGDLDLVKFLVYNGVRYDLTDKAGRTAQYYPRARYHRKVQKFLRFIAKMNKRPQSHTPAGNLSSESIQAKLASYTRATAFTTATRGKGDGTHKMDLNSLNTRILSRGNKEWTDEKLKKMKSGDGIIEQTLTNVDTQFGNDAKDIQTSNLPDIIPKPLEIKKAFSKKGEKPIVDLAKRKLKEDSRKEGKKQTEAGGKNHAALNPKMDLSGEKKKGVARGARQMETSGSRKEDPRAEQQCPDASLQEKMGPKVVPSRLEEIVVAEEKIGKGVDKVLEPEKENKRDGRSIREPKKAGMKKEEKKTENEQISTTKTCLKMEEGGGKKEACKEELKMEKINIMKTKKEAANVKKTKKEEVETENAMQTKGEANSQEVAMKIKAMAITTKEKTKTEVIQTKTKNEEAKLEGNALKIKENEKPEETNTMKAKREEVKMKIPMQSKIEGKMEEIVLKEKREEAKVENANAVKTKKEEANIKKKKESKTEAGMKKRTEELTMAEVTTQVSINQLKKQTSKEDTKIKEAKKFGAKTWKQTIEEKGEENAVNETAKTRMTKTRSTTNITEDMEASNGKTGRKNIRAKQEEIKAIKAEETEIKKIEPSVNGEQITERKANKRKAEERFEAKTGVIKTDKLTSGTNKERQREDPKRGKMGKIELNGTDGFKETQIDGRDRKEQKSYNPEVKEDGDNMTRVSRVPVGSAVPPITPECAMSVKPKVPVANRKSTEHVVSATPKPSKDAEPSVPVANPKPSKAAEPSVTAANPKSSKAAEPSVPSANPKPSKAPEPSVPSANPKPSKAAESSMSGANPKPTKPLPAAANPNSNESAEPLAPAANPRSTMTPEPCEGLPVYLTSKPEEYPASPSLSDSAEPWESAVHTARSELPEPLVSVLHMESVEQTVSPVSSAVPTYSPEPRLCLAPIESVEPHVSVLPTEPTEPWSCSAPAELVEPWESAAPPALSNFEEPRVSAASTETAEPLGSPASAEVPEPWMPAIPSTPTEPKASPTWAPTVLVEPPVLATPIDSSEPRVPKGAVALMHGLKAVGNKTITWNPSAEGEQCAKQLREKGQPAALVTNGEQTVVQLSEKVGRLTDQLVNRKQIVTELRDEVGSLKNQLLSREQTIAKITSSLGRLTDQLTNKGQEVIHLSNKVGYFMEELTNREQTIAQLSVELNRLGHEISFKEKTIAQLKRKEHMVVQLTEEVGHLTDQLRNKEEAVAQLTNELSALKDHLTNSKQAVTRLTNEMGRLTNKEQENEQFTNKVEHLAGQLANKEETVNQLQNEARRLADQLANGEEIKIQLANEAVCLKDQLSKEEETVARLSNEVGLLADELTSREEAVAQLTNEVEYLGDQLAQREEGLVQLTNKIQHLSNQLANKEETVNQFAHKVEDLTNRLKDKDERLLQLTNEVDDLKGQLRDRKDAVDPFTEELKCLEGQLRKEVDHLRDQLASKEQTIAELTSEVRHLTDQVESMDTTAAASQEEERVAAARERDDARVQVISMLQGRVDHLSLQLVESDRLALKIQEKHKALCQTLETEKRQREDERKTSQREIASLTSQLQTITNMSKEPEDSSSKIKRSGLRSLPNLGNISYINSVLQCLFSISSIKDYFTNDSYRNDVNENSENRGRVATALGQVMKAFQSEQGTVEALSNFKAVMESCSRKVTFNMQEEDDDNDDDEVVVVEGRDLLALLLTKLHQDLTPITMYRCSLKHHQEPEELKCSSMVSRMFHSVHETHVICSRSNLIVARTREHFPVLNLDLHTDGLLEDLIKQHYEPRHVEWPCSACGRPHMCQQVSYLVRLPQLLVVCLNRNKTKETRIDFPLEDLSLQECTMPSICSKVYSLWAFCGQRSEESASTCITSSANSSTIDPNKTSNIPNDTTTTDTITTSFATDANLTTTTTSSNIATDASTISTTENSETDTSSPTTSFANDASASTTSSFATSDIATTTTSSFATDTSMVSCSSTETDANEHTTASCTPYSAFCCFMDKRRWRDCSGKLQEEYPSTLLQDSHPTILFYVAQN